MSLPVKSGPLCPNLPVSRGEDTEAGPTPLAAETEVQNLIGLLNDEDMVGDTHETFFEILGRHLRRLLNEEKRSKTCSVKTLLDLTVVSDYNVLREKLRLQGYSTPSTTASEQIASCKPADPSGANPKAKGDWYARKLRV